MNPSLESCLPQVYRFAYSLTRDVHLAEDLAHDTLLRAVERQQQLQSLQALRPWLFRIAANLWKDWLRKRARQPETEADAFDLPDAVVAATPDLNEDVHAALQVLDTLPAQQRAVLHLYAVEDFALPDIAEILNLKPDTARVHLCLARRAVRQRLPHIWNELKSSQQ